MVFETLNRLKWNGEMGSCSVTILHRGAPDDRKTVEGTDIVEVKKSYFTYKSRGKECAIPLHRVLEIRAGGEILWKRKTRKG
jgi:uncharacterized protein (UPF0248 family)